MPNYRLKNSAGDWRKGDVVTEKDIQDNAALGGLKRLQSLGAVEETDDEPHQAAFTTPSPDETKGDNVDPGTDDDVDKRAERRAEAVGKLNDGKRTLGDKPAGDSGDAAEHVTPRGGRPGTVVRTSNTNEGDAGAKPGKK
jgi:hypothetical protein